MKIFRSSITSPHWGKALLLLFGAFAISHLIYFLLGNGMCAGWGTGLIHGTPADGAGALPHIIDFENYSQLRPLRPWLSWPNLVLFCFLFFVLAWALATLLRIPFIKDKRASLRILALLGISASLIFFASSLESYTSCNLRNTHLNIQEVFKRLQEQSHGGELGNASITVGGRLVDALEVAKDSNGYLIELKGHGGEPTCSAYIVADAITKKGSDDVSEKLYPAWTTAKEIGDPKTQGLKKIIMQNDFLSGRLTPSFLNIKEIKETGNFEAAHPPQEFRKYYSIVACTKWPHGWINEIE
ncbi:hypothetical protein [Variovorax sp. GB1P17]|uniref:hypothetical protein n=1 Tax=Variovorax sp. GB1P17 TaxID=3443740 RepID=UPI003F449CA8